MFLQGSIDEVPVIGEDGAIASELFTLLQRNILESLIHLCKAAGCILWGTTLDKQIGMSFVKSGYVIGLTAVSEDHVKESNIICERL